MLPVLEAQESKGLKVWGIETQIDLINCDPYIIRSSDDIKKYARELSSFLKVKRYGDPMIAHYGDEETSGYSVVQFIEKSHIIGHFANKTNNAYINVFCSKPYDPRTIAEFTKRYFKAKSYSTNSKVRA